MLQYMEAATAHAVEKEQAVDTERKKAWPQFQAHKDDLDKGGYPYVFHPFYLATQMDDEASTCVALLHDVIEDHGDVYSHIADLERAGFPKHPCSMHSGC